MIHWCAYCDLNTAGQHEQDCPNHPDNIKKQVYLRKYYPTDRDGTKEWSDGADEQ